MEKHCVVIEIYLTLSCNTFFKHMYQRDCLTILLSTIFFSNIRENTKWFVEDKERSKHDIIGLPSQIQSASSHDDMLARAVGLFAGLQEMFGNMNHLITNIKIYIQVL